MLKRAKAPACVAMGLALALSATPATAQVPDPPPGGAPQSGAPAAQPADELSAKAAADRKAGDQAMEALRYTDALAAYESAYAITSDPALLYNMGRALQALGRFPDALEKLEAFERSADAGLKARVPRLAKLIADLRQRVGSLTVRTNVAGARVLVRNTVVGRSPLPAPVRLNAGTAEVEVEADGYFPAKRTVQLPGGTDVTVTMDLFSRETTGVLSVSASSAGAEVLVDGRRLGVAPLETNVASGSHRVMVRHPDFRTFETSVVVPAGGSRAVTANLQNPSVFTRWWFWGGVGAVAAAGVVVAIAAVSERPADSGSIAPGQLRTSTQVATPSMHRGAPRQVERGSRVPRQLPMGVAPPLFRF